MAASRSNVIALVNAIRVTLGFRQEHFFADAKITASVSWLHNSAFLEMAHSMSGVGPKFLDQAYWARAVSFFLLSVLSVCVCWLYLVFNILDDIPMQYALVALKVAL